MDLLGLLSGSNLASANGPDGLVGDDNVGPVRDLRLERLDLGRDELNGLASLTGLEGLAAAPDDLEAVLGGVLGLGGDDLIRLADDGSTLRVAEDSPVDIAILELGDGDLASESTVGLVVDVLGGNLDFLAESLADKGEVEGRRGDNDLYNWCMLVECFANRWRMRGSVELGRESRGRELRNDVPAFLSRSALLRFSTISLMDDLEPFL